MLCCFSHCSAPARDGLQGRAPGSDAGVQCQLFEGLRSAHDIALMSDGELRGMLLDAQLRLKLEDREKRKLIAQLKASEGLLERSMAR
jgi:hypothetical protein